MSHRLFLMYQMDPRGAKVGGIETHLRLLCRRHPADFSVLFVGVDEIGDCTIGAVNRITVDGRTIDFFPVARIVPEELNRAATKLLRSATLRLVTGALRHAPAIRRALGKGPATAELQRFETALFAWLLGLPAIQVVHGEGSKGEKMDSLIKKYWFIHAFNERLALSLAKRIVGVNPAIVARIGREWPQHAAKADMITVSVDPDVFPARPFDTADGVFRVGFAGRLDEFKDPPLMFATMARLHAALGGAFEFHYIGGTDPSRYPAFQAIERFTVRHGLRPAAEVARIMAGCHAGVLTSYFEGMPCYLLETLATGRPVVAIRLPQYDPLVLAGVSGQLIERLPTEEASADALAAAFLSVWSEIRAGRLSPEAIAARTAPFTVEAQMGRLFAMHRALVGTPEDGALRAAAARS
jgi:glycosyltransferase involved in cell wall biosynthesis